MRVHILGICGTFMGGIAAIARELGMTVSGSDSGVYPPMSQQLEALGIHLQEGYAADHLQPAPDLVIVGNAVSRGNPAVEYLLDQGLPYISGPQWLAEQVLQHRHVLAVAGTHGKTTTTSMLTWILEQNGLEPGYLIGGVPQGLPGSARLGSGKYFVIEADEYDTAFFDKRSKFVHYHPRTLIINNIEFDHADIFADIAAIQKQFHHLVRTVPGRGRIVCPADDEVVNATLAQGCWTPLTTLGDTAANWRFTAETSDLSAFKVHQRNHETGVVRWTLMGRHNALNALAAIAAAAHIGIAPGESCRALSQFMGVKRRMEIVGVVNDITLYDDFAHHPTAIATTLGGLRHRVGSQRIVAVFEPRSNTMRLGTHKATLAAAFEAADEVVLLQPADVPWDLNAALASLGTRKHAFDSVDGIVRFLAESLNPQDHCLIMSNGGFGGLQGKLLAALQG